MNLQLIPEDKQVNHELIPTESIPLPNFMLANIRDAEEFIPKFKLDLVKVVRVYDGDTYKVIGFICDCNRPWKFTVRLRGIDCPELNGPDHKQAIEVRNRVAQLILGKVVTILKVGRDKYGRLLARIIVDGLDLTSWLLEEGYGYEYYGHKKRK